MCVTHFCSARAAPCVARGALTRPMPGQKRTNRPRTQPWKTKSTRSRSSLPTSGTTSRDPHRKNLGQRSRVHVVAKVEVAEKAPEKVGPEAPARTSKPAPASSKGSKTFETIQKKHGLTLFHEKESKELACFDSGKCGREHICIGCGKTGVPYNDCFCLESSA